MKLAALALLTIATASSSYAQDRDFLTPNEADQIREAQDPNDRLVIYVKFARQRLDLVRQYLAKDKPGRSIFIHNALEDYNRIIESMDLVSDDALRRHVDISKGTDAVIGAEHDFLAQLNKIQESEPSDFGRYKFLVSEAVDTTSDSQQMSKEDASKRTGELAATDSKEQKEREAMMPTKEVKDRKKDAQIQDQPKRKLPTLLKPGEKANVPQ